MKYMGWGPDDYDACGLSLREEIVAIMREESAAIAQAGSE